MRRIIVLTIFVLVAFAIGAKAQSTWDHPWPGASHFYMATVTDPENDNKVRWFVATNAAGTIKANYNTDYSFITDGYNPVTKQLEGTAVYVVEINWGGNIADKTDFYIVLEVDDDKSNCTNRMALHVQTKSVFNAFVSDLIADPSCPEDVVNPLWNGLYQTDIGNSELVFRIERQNSMLDWQFEFGISESSAQPFSIDSIRYVDNMGTVLPVLNQAANLTSGEVGVTSNQDWVLARIYIRNQMGVTLHLNFDLITANDLTKDSADNLDAILTDNRADHTIQSMPVITNFSGN
jgi:hypothetical protein